MGGFAIVAGTSIFPVSRNINTNGVPHIDKKKKDFVMIGNYLDANLYLHLHTAFPILLSWSLGNQSKAANIRC